MKTYHNLYPQVWAFENLYEAWRKARKGKRHREQAAAFERTQEAELLALEAELHEFTDDIAFKMTAGVETSGITPEVTSSTDTIARTWSGSITNTAGTFTTLVELSIQPGCEPGRVCGTFSAPQLPCSGDLFLQEMDGETYVFIEQNVSGAASCASGGYEYLQLFPDGTLAYSFALTPGTAYTSSGILARP